MSPEVAGGVASGRRRTGRLDAAPFDVPVAGGRLGVVRYGDPGGAPTVVAVHGITANSRAWWPVAPALGDRAELVAVDLRGRGDSRELPEPYGFAAHVADLLALFDALGLERAVLAGHSLGAYVVAEFAGRHPDRVESVLLVDGGLAIPGSEDADPEAVAASQLAPVVARFSLEFARLEDYLDWWRQHPSIRGGQVDAEALAQYAAHDLVGAAPPLRPRANEAAIRADLLEVAGAGAAAAALTVPARLLLAPRGMLDQPEPLFALDAGREWAAADPARRSVALVPDVNHYTIAMGAGAAVVADGLAELVAAG